MRASIRRLGARISLAFIAGALSPLAFAPTGYYPLAPLGLGVLFYLWDEAERDAAILTGFFFGLGLFGFGVWWIQISVHQFGLPNYFFSIAVTVAFVLVLSVYPALCGYLVSIFPSSHRWRRILLLYPAAWTATELLRGCLFTGFPWLLIGYSQIDSPLAGFAPVLGVYGVSFFTAFFAAAVVVLFRADKFWRRVSMVAIVALTLSAIGLKDFRWTSASGSVKSIALVQAAIPQAVKWNRAYRQPSIDFYTELSQPHWGKSLIIWPETAIPAFAEEVSESIAHLSARAKDSGTSLLIGMPSGKSFTDGKYYNSVVQFGATSGRYDKRHLVPFGEYLPFDNLLRPITNFLRIPMSNFSAGKSQQTLLQADGYSIGVSICYEDAYASEVASALPTANVLVNVSNDAWFGDSIAPHQHLQIARMRALENERYLLRATNTGFSAIINDRGEIEGISKQFVSDVVSGDMTPRRGVTPFSRYGFSVILGCCLSVFGGFFCAAMWRGRGSPD